MALILTFSVLLGGCSSLYEHHGYGELARSQRIDGKPATPVTLPANAPSITQRYRPAPIASGQGGHNGVDLFLPVGTPILAAADGVVRTVQLSVLYGNQIFVDHGVDEWGDTIQTRYFHLDETRVEEGASVSRGQQIGNSGVTGIYAMFPHLHFEVRVNGAVGSDAFNLEETP
ncbi:MAG: M23 family metallopeptidase, partial [Pseudomonadota bacterium]